MPIHENDPTVPTDPPEPNYVNPVALSIPLSFIRHCSCLFLAKILAMALLYAPLCRWMYVLCFQLDRSMGDDPTLQSSPSKGSLNGRQLNSIQFNSISYAIRSWRWTLACNYIAYLFINVLANCSNLLCKYGLKCNRKLGHRKSNL